MAERASRVPEGWVMTTVGHIGAVRLGRQRSPDQHTGQFATKYIRAANITANGIDVTDVLEMDLRACKVVGFVTLTGALGNFHCLVGNLDRAA